jgi:hypothetical protein
MIGVRAMDKVFAVRIQGKLFAGELTWEEALKLVEHETKWAAIVDTRTNWVVWKNT